ncbi:MAG TPA: hypothetical protein VMW65_03970, partial [Chloroflexota bacterium]|nr:hypothetical protein [Chloroflexota bacterium]
PRGRVGLSPAPATPFRVPSPRRARWLLLLPPDELRPEERTYREILLARDPEIAAARTLAADYGVMARPRARLPDSS